MGRWAEGYRARSNTTIVIGLEPSRWRFVKNADLFPPVTRHCWHRILGCRELLHDVTIGMINGAGLSVSSRFSADLNLGL